MMPNRAIFGAISKGTIPNAVPKRCHAKCAPKYLFSSLLGTVYRGTIDKERQPAAMGIRVPLSQTLFSVAEVSCRRG